MESFGAKFPRIYLDSGFKGWFVSTLLLGKCSIAPHHILCFIHRATLLTLGLTVAAWFGSLVNGPLADRFGRKWSMQLAVIIFVVGSAIQAGAVSVAMIFVGKLESF